MERAALDVTGLRALVTVLRDEGYEVYAPVLSNNAVTPAVITSIDDLPRGVVDEQTPAHYSTKSAGNAYFGQAATATSWKPLLFPAHRALWRFDAGGVPTAPAVDPTRRALLGVRSCDLAAIRVLDEVLLRRGAVDEDYAQRRRNLFVVAVVCGAPASTCFCTSMGTGPRPHQGFDLAITEILEGEHRFVVDCATDVGAAVLARLPKRSVTDDDVAAAERVVADTSAAITRHVDTTGIRDLLYANIENPRWDEVATRCLACTNCTLVCPTCFCVTTDEVVSLTGVEGRDRVWDSCFNADHSYLHGGGPVRSSTQTRYRQWLTHKFGSWIDQFGSSGCVGCGRCITWCPAGIDVTEELAAIRATSGTTEDGP